MCIYTGASKCCSTTLHSSCGVSNTMPMAQSASQVLSLLALLVQKYKY